MDPDRADLLCRERDNALSLLERLHILTATANPGKPRAYALTNPFAASLRLALTGGGSHNSFGVPYNVSEEDAVPVVDLDEFARRQWEGVLGYMVGSTGMNVASEGVTLSQGVKMLLASGGLVEARGKTVEITKDGFAFILQEVNAQVWTMLILYLQNAESVRPVTSSWIFSVQAKALTSQQLNMDEVDVLSFLFMLGSLELGLPYSKAKLSQTQTNMLEDLGDFGIVYQPSPDSSYFYPTRLATTLTSDAGGLRSSSFASSAEKNRGFIVIETNYRIYAYTSSNLQIAILQLFTRLITRYPNMVAGKVTRESIRRAVSMGITSDQIISYLTTHAHPQMAKNQPVLPPTVVDQIRLWQLEGDRMKATVGFLFKDFHTQAEFEAPCRYAEEIGVLVWRHEGQRKFFVTRHEQVAAYLRNKSGKGG